MPFEAAAHLRGEIIASEVLMQVTSRPKRIAKCSHFGAQRRDQLARRYRERLAGSRFLELPALSDSQRHGWHLFVVMLRPRASGG